MSLQFIYFTKKNSYASRQKTIDNLNEWLTRQVLNRQMSKLQEKWLRDIIKYAKRFTQYKSLLTSYERMKICEAIFVNADLPEDKFFQKLRIFFVSIKNNNSELKRLLVMAYRAFLADCKNKQIAKDTTFASFLNTIEQQEAALACFEKSDVGTNLTENIAPKALSAQNTSDNNIANTTAQDATEVASNHIPTFFAQPVRNATPSPTSPGAVVQLDESKIATPKVQAVVKPVPSLTELIADFEIDTSHLKIQDQRILTHVAMLSLGVLTIALCTDKSSFAANIAATTVLATYTLIWNCVFNPQRAAIAVHQQQGLINLLNIYNSLTQEGIEVTNTLSNLQLAETLAPYISSHDLVPWSDLELSRASLPFINLIAAPPHNIYHIDLPDVKLPVTQNISLTFFRGVIGAAIGIKNDAHDYPEEYKQKKLAKKRYYHSRFSYYDRFCAEINAKLYGLPEKLAAREEIKTSLQKK